MKFECLILLFVLCFSCLIFCVISKKVIEDNEFAEFEDFEDDEVTYEPEEKKEDPIKIPMAPEASFSSKEMQEKSEEEIEEEDDDDATVLDDEDEFEGFETEKKSKSKRDKLQDIKIVKVPLHLQSNWDCFYMEMLMLAGLGAYLLNYIAGRNKNQKIAQTWFSTHKQLLEENFSVVGDDGQGAEVVQGGLAKEAENVYWLWCSGRVGCEGTLITLKLVKRQDLVNTIARILRPTQDQIIVKVVLDEGEMEPLVFCLCHKKSISKMHKDHEDLTNYCPEKKNLDKFQLPSHFQLLSESSEVTSFILDSKVTTVLKRFEDSIEFLHFSDQYSGVKQTEDNQNNKPPEASKVLMFCFNLTDKKQDSIEQMKPLMQMVFYCLDKIKRFRLSKESKIKADKNRQKVLEAFQKAAHLQRSEAAQNRKEEKRRAEKEKIMNEDDPEKQRRLEEKNLKKEAKKKQPKMKRMKIKAM